MKFCSHCSAPLSRGIPEGDLLERFFCSDCGMVHYENPRMVVGCIPTWQDKILLCLRDIEPRRNRWTLPAGYLEIGETLQQGARRETLEETRAEVISMSPYLMVDLIKIRQVYLMFRCQLAAPEFGPTAESLEVRLFQEKDIPWNNLAFPVIEETLQYYFNDSRTGSFVFRNVVGSKYLAK